MASFESNCSSNYSVDGDGAVDISVSLLVQGDCYSEEVIVEGHYDFFGSKAQYSSTSHSYIR